MKSAATTEPHVMDRMGAWDECGGVAWFAREHYPTPADMRAAFDAIKNAPPHPCSLGHHFVHPKVYRRGGWTNCANCGKAVFCGGD